MAWGAGVFRREEEMLKTGAGDNNTDAMKAFHEFEKIAAENGLENAFDIIARKYGPEMQEQIGEMAFDKLYANRERKLDGDLAIYNTPEIIKDLVVLNKITGHNSEKNTVTVNGVILEFSNNKTNKASALENTDVNLFYTLINAANKSNVDKVHVNYTYWNSATHGNGKSIDIGWIQGVDSNEIHNYRKANDGNSFYTNEDKPESDLMKRFRQEFLNENNGSGYRVWTPHKMVSNGNADTVGSYDYDNVIGGLPGLVSALKGKKSGSIEKWYQISDPTIFRDERIEFKKNSEGYYETYLVRSQTVKQAYNSWYARTKNRMPNYQKSDIWNNYMHYDHGHFEVY